MVPIIFYHEISVGSSSLVGHTRVVKFELDTYKPFYSVLLCTESFAALKKGELRYSNTWLPVSKHWFLGVLGIGFKFKTRVKAEKMAKKMEKKTLAAERMRQSLIVRRILEHSRKKVTKMDLEATQLYKVHH